MSSERDNFVNPKMTAVNQNFNYCISSFDPDTDVLTVS